MTHQLTKSAARSRLSVLIAFVLVMLSAAGCSSSGSSTDASSAGPSVPRTTGTATSPPNTTTGSTTPPAGNDTKAVCTRVITIVQDSSRSAIAALTPALQTGDQKKVVEAEAKAHVYYRQAADRLRAEATGAQSATLRTEIVNAAAYFDKAAQTSTSTGTDKSLTTLSQACSGSR